jgi:hydrogenase-1 operon protein HyaE
MSQNFSGLLDRLVATHDVADLDAAGLKAFIEAPGNGVVLLLDEPDRVAESWDLAVIFPELLASAGIPARAALLRPAQALDQLGRFGINRLPALLFLRDGGYVGVIEGLRDWNEFVADCRTMLQTPVSRPPGIGIAVTAAAASGCH